MNRVGSSKCQHLLSTKRRGGQLWESLTNLQPYRSTHRGTDHNDTTSLAGDHQQHHVICLRKLCGRRKCQMESGTGILRHYDGLSNNWFALSTFGSPLSSHPHLLYYMRCVFQRAASPKNGTLWHSPKSKGGPHVHHTVAGDPGHT